MENSIEKEQQIRLNKYLAECGVCSRREADRLIEKGKVSIDGQTAMMGSKVTKDSIVKLNGKSVTVKQDKTVIAYYKPAGVTCTEKDAHAKITITKSLNYPERVTYAGRLDKDSEGLMIMSNDGDLIHRMMKASNHHEKEYIVKINKEITQDFLFRMSNGLYLKELDETTRKCSVDKIGNFTFRIILTQGLNRQIRRMCETLNYRVMQLKRVRVMNVRLGNLKIGDYRQITGEELEILYKQAGYTK